MADTERKVQMCTCENCGNEAEMAVTCEWVTLKAAPKGEKEAAPPARQEKRTFTCINCGNEAEMFVDL